MERNNSWEHEEACQAPIISTASVTAWINFKPVIINSLKSFLSQLSKQLHLSASSEKNSQT